MMPLIQGLLSNGLSLVANAVMAKGQQFVEDKLGVKLAPDMSPEQVAQFTPAQLNQLVPVLTPQQLTALGRDKQAALDNPSSRQQSQPVPRPTAEKPPNRPPPVLQR